MTGRDARKDAIEALLAARREIAQTAAANLPPLAALRLLRDAVLEACERHCREPRASIEAAELADDAVRSAASAAGSLARWLSRYLSYTREELASLLEQAAACVAGEPSSLGRAAFLMLRLSPRERQLVELARHGMAVKDIAAASGLSVNTVKDYLKTVYRKLDVHKMVEMMARLQDTPGVLAPGPVAQAAASAAARAPRPEGGPPRAGIADAQHRYFSSSGGARK